jgi:hypothetical protein
MSQIISTKLAQDYKRFEKEVEKKKMKEWIKKNEKELNILKGKETGVLSPPDIESNMPVIDPKKDLDRNPSKIKPKLAPDGGPSGSSILKDGKWIPLVEASHGKLIKGFPKLTKRGWK